MTFALRNTALFLPQPPVIDRTVQIPVDWQSMVTRDAHVPVEWTGFIYLPPSSELPAQTILTPQLVETAVQSVIALLRSRFNQELAAVRMAYDATGRVTINLPNIPPDRYYISEVIDPLQLPAIFVIAERSEGNLDEAQNFELTDHMLLVVILIEDTEITRLTRAVWRMGLAAYRVLHDRAFNNMMTFVEAYDYSPTYGRREEGGVRNFRKDVTIRVRARLYEAF